MNQNQTPATQGKKSPIILILVLILAILIVAALAFYFLLYRSNSTSTTATVSPSVSASASATVSVAPSGTVKATHCLKTPAKSTQIIVTSPADYAEVSGTNLTIKGTANAFENQFDYRIKDCNNETLATGFVTAEGEMGQNPPFERTFSIQKQNSADIYIEFYEQSMADGSETNLTQLPLRLK
jgi:hypothetical protein